MGGCCCCCSSKELILNPAPPFYYYPRASEEQVPLSSHHGAPAATLSTGLLVDTNLNMSVPTVYRCPAPVPFDVALARPQTPQQDQEASRDKTDGAAQTTNSGSDQQIAAANTRETSTKCDDAKDSDCNTQINLEVDPSKELEIELPKSVEHLVFPMEEDVCPTCLEEYDVENPKITTKCEHHFHLACILEWMERSDTCPVSKTHKYEKKEKNNEVNEIEE